MVLEIVQREIPLCGTGYLILRDCPEDRLSEGIGRGMERLKRSGAKRIFAVSLPMGDPLQPGPLGLWRLESAYDMISMACSLGVERPKPEIKLALRPIKRAQDERTWLALIQKAYADVPGAHVKMEGDLHLSNHRNGLAWQGDRAVGAYGVDLSEKIPHITDLAIIEPERRKGMGRALFYGLMRSFGKAERSTCTVCSLDERALAFCQHLGFAPTGTSVHWCEVV